MRIMHLLYQSLPHLVGSSIRSRDILISQKSVGLEVIVVTSPFQLSTDRQVRKEVIHDIEYIRTANPNTKLRISEGDKKSLFIRLRKFFKIFSFTYKVFLIAKANKVEIIHSHATFFMGFAGKFIAVILGVPFVYEVRSLWDERQRQHAKTKIEKISSYLITILENLMLKVSDHVIVINDQLKKNLISRGAKESKISVIKNAVNFNIIPKKTRRAFNSNDIRFGYIGSLTKIEGLLFLVETFRNLNNDSFLLIYGSGHMETEISKLIEKYNLQNVKLMGELKPEAIAQAYENVDVIINPRLRNKLTESVTPLKPLEAMAYRKLFIGSDVGGIVELVKDGYNGIIFNSENQKSLLSKIQFVTNKKNSAICESIIENGYNIVKEKYNWENNALIYQRIYSKLIS